MSDGRGSVIAVQIWWHRKVDAMPIRDGHLACSEYGTQQSSRLLNKPFRHTIPSVLVEHIFVIFHIVSQRDCNFELFSAKARGVFRKMKTRRRR
eukprot:6193854-Pleurochrysis_carterae.AAC.1